MGTRTSEPLPYSVRMPAHRVAARASTALLCLLLAACATRPPALDAAALATEMQRRPNVLLGEVHDNRAQHAARAAALQRVLEAGARPALAFEQLDRDRQAALDSARRAELPPGTERVDHLIAQAGTSGWDWPLYRPYLALALQYDLPIVAANLSRADATRVTREGFGAVFDAATRARLELDALPAALVEAQENAVRVGHCNLLPPAAASRLARAQIARDAALAESIRPYLAPGGRGVILFTGNGHVRTDIGVPFFLGAQARAHTWSIGLIEDAFVQDRASARGAFDARLVSSTQPRPDPCEGLRQRPPA